MNTKSVEYITSLDYLKFNLLQTECANERVYLWLFVMCLSFIGTLKSTLKKQKNNNLNTTKK